MENFKMHILRLVDGCLNLTMYFTIFIVVLCILISVNFSRQHVHSIKLDKVLKLKITLACSYMYRSMTVIREPSPEPS